MNSGTKPPMSDVRRARMAVATVFAVHGAVTGNFATRVPWIQDHAGVSAGQLGLALAFPAIGASWRCRWPGRSATASAPAPRCAGCSPCGRSR